MPQELTGKVVVLLSRVYIESAVGGNRVEFDPLTPGVWDAPDGKLPRENDEVGYQLDGRGRKPVRVRLIRRARVEEDTRKQSSVSTDVFLNPYNFVRPLPDLPEPEDTPPEIRLLGRCPPPPLDRYVGLTGSVRCRLTTHGPVFVSDSYDVRVGDGGHRSYRSFRAPDGAPCIPGSTLRGAVRSVFEAATSSCWEHVRDRPMSRRLITEDAKVLVPGCLRWNGCAWEVELLTGTSGYCPDGPVVQHRPFYAAWALRYRNAAHGRARSVIPPWVVHGTRCWARIRFTALGRFDIWHVDQIDGSPASLHTTEVDGGKVRVVEGYYFCTGRNIDRKHDERFFFRDDPAPPLSLPVRDETVRLYLDLLADYREKHADEKRAPECTAGGQGATKWDEVYASRFVHQAKPATEVECDGQLVYVWAVRHGAATAVRALAPVAVPRLFWEHGIWDRLPAPESMEPCSRFNRRRGRDVRLCPACRVFGWVSQDDPDERVEPDERRTVAWRSRVRFGDALLATATADGQPLRQDDPLALDEKTLPILSAPKPTAVRFYLRPVRGPLRPERDENAIDYDSYTQGANGKRLPTTVVRGRKFYRGHHEADLDCPDRSDQNRTIRDRVKAKQQFTFTVHFENLAPVELGALLWAMELEKGWLHRLGYGKPLGLGAVKLSVEELTLHWNTRHAEAAPQEGLRRRGLVERFQELFRASLGRRYGGEFPKLDNVADLRALLGNSPRDLTVHYPTLGPVAPGLPESFEWFGVNRRGKKLEVQGPGQGRGEKRNGLGHWLGLADGDPGLPFDPTRELPRRP